MRPTMKKIMWIDVVLQEKYKHDCQVDVCFAFFFFCNVILRIFANSNQSEYN